MPLTLFNDFMQLNLRVMSLITTVRCWKTFFDSFFSSYLLHTFEWNYKLNTWKGDKLKNLHPSPIKERSIFVKWIWKDVNNNNDFGLKNLLHTRFFWRKCVENDIVYCWIWQWQLRLRSVAAWIWTFIHPTICIQDE